MTCHLNACTNVFARGRHALARFSDSPIWRPQLRGIPSSYRVHIWYEKTRMAGLQSGEGHMMIRWTDRHPVWGGDSWGPKAQCSPDFTHAFDHRWGLRQITFATCYSCLLSRCVTCGNDATSYGAQVSHTCPKSKRGTATIPTRYYTV